jgi:hypothetical protein
MAEEVKKVSKKAELEKFLEQLRLSPEQRRKALEIAFRPPQGKVYPVGYTRYELILYRDIKQEDGSWKTTIVRVVPKTDNFNEVTKILPNAKKLLEQAEAKEAEE